jgi:hypothetical protein
MANANTAFGLKPLRDAASGPTTGGLEMFYVPATDGTALYIGDPVAKTGEADAAGTAAVIRAVAAGPITGVVQGFVPDGTTNMVGYRAANTAAYVICCTDPNAVFEIQDSAAFVPADVGLNALMTVGTGNAYTKRSGFTLGAKAATATHPLKIMGVVPRVGNEASQYAKVLVKINFSTEGHASLGY